MEVQAQIRFFLSDRGRKHSLIIGGDGKREQWMSGVITDMGDLELFNVDENGGVTLDATMIVRAPENEDSCRFTGRTDFEGRREAEWHFVPRWPDLLKAARTVLSEDEIPIDAEELAYQAEAERTFLSDPTARATQITDEWVTFADRSFGTDSPVFAEALKRWNADREANRVILANWVREHGTENQRQRLEAGLLAWQEAFDGMMESVFAPLASFPTYRRFEIAEVCEHVKMGEPACKVKFRSVDATSLSAEEWETYSKIKAAMPSAAFQLRDHSAECSLFGWPVVRRGVIVKVEIGTMKFKREFALTKVEA